MGASDTGPLSHSPGIIAVHPTTLIERLSSLCLMASCPWPHSNPETLTYTGLWPPRSFKGSPLLGLSVVASLAVSSWLLLPLSPTLPPRSHGLFEDKEILRGLFNHQTPGLISWRPNQSALPFELPKGRRRGPCLIFSLLCCAFITEALIRKDTLRG